MEKPKKMELLDKTQTIIHVIRAFASYGIGARIYGDGVDDIHLQRAITAAKEIEAMSTWIEGQLPSRTEISNVVQDVFAGEGLLPYELRDSMRKYSDEIGEAIHVLLTRKLTGKV